MHDRKDSSDLQSVICNETMSLWHWLVVIGTSLGTVLANLIPHSFGALIGYFQSLVSNSTTTTLFNSTQFQMNWLPAVSSAFPCIFLPLFAIIVYKLSRSYQLLSATSFLLLAISCGLSSLVNLWYLLFFSYSCLYSLGSSLYLAVTIIILAEYFPVNHKCHVLATSLFQIGYPVASLIGNPVLAILILKYGWKISFKAISVFELLCGIIIAVLMKPLRFKGFCKHIEDENDNELSNKNLISTTPKPCSTTSLNQLATAYEIWPWLIGKFINYMCWYGFRTNVVTYFIKTTSFGFRKSANLMSIYAVAEIIIALIASFCGDKFRGKLIHIHTASAVILAVLTGVFNFAVSSYLCAVLLMICIGAMLQASLSFGYPASAEVMHSKFDMKTGWIFTNVAAGLGILVSPLFSGILIDYFGVASLFYSQCCGWVLQVILYQITLLLMIINKRKSDYANL